MAWQPPRRPTELKNYHIIDLHAEKLANPMDYFAAVHTRRVEERQAALQQQAPITEQARTTAPTGSKAMVDMPAVSTTSTIQRRTPATTQVLSQKIVTIEQQKPLLLKKITRYKKLFLVLIFLALITALGYTVFHLILERQKRIPAAAIPKTSASPTYRNIKPSIQPTTEDTLGSGKRSVQRNTGGVTRNSLITAPPPQAVLQPVPQQAASVSQPATTIAEQARLANPQNHGEQTETQPYGNQTQPYSSEGYNQTQQERHPGHQADLPTAPGQPLSNQAPLPPDPGQHAVSQEQPPANTTPEALPPYSGPNF